MDIKSMIMQMYYGLQEQTGVKWNSEEESKILDEVVKKDKEFIKTLTPEQVKMYNETKSALDDLNAEESDRYFAEGFRCGIIMGMDIFGDR